MENGQLDISGIAILLDIDGTLIDSVTGPEWRFADADLRRLLVRLHDAVDGALCFVTGRSMTMVDEIFGDLELPTFALFGLEQRLVVKGSKVVSETPHELERAAARARELLARHPELIFQPKGAMYAVDTRFAPQAKTAVQQALATVLPLAGEDYVVVTGHRVVELAPRRAVKGAAIEQIMGSAPFLGRMPVFIGDDEPDESGFKVVNRLGGLTIRVNPKGETAARHVMPAVADVRRYLAGLLEPDGVVAPARSDRFLAD